MKVTNYSSPGQMKITNDDQLSRAALIKPLLSLQFLALLYIGVDHLAKVKPHKSKASKRLQKPHYLIW